MIERKYNALDGTIITRLIPENDEDINRLRKLDDENKLDTRSSFADDPDIRNSKNKN